MADLNNLPGIYVNKEDGNLQILDAIPGNVTLIIGTSPDGPTDSLYLVSDTKTAELMFDPDGTKEGTLLKGMHEALSAGAPYIALYRMGAKKAVVDFLNGHKITINRVKTNIESQISIYYKADIGNANHDELIRLYYDGNLIYDNLANLNVAGMVSIEGVKSSNSFEDICGTISLAYDYTAAVGADASATLIATVPDETLLIGTTLYFTDENSTARALTVGTYQNIDSSTTEILTLLDSTGADFPIVDLGNANATFVAKAYAQNAALTEHVSIQLSQINTKAFTSATALTAYGVTAATKFVTKATGDNDVIPSGSLIAITGATGSGDNAQYIVDYSYIAESAETGIVIGDKVIVLKEKVGSTSWTGFAAPDTSVGVSILVRAINSSNGTSLTFQEKYEELQRAYSRLETAKVDMVLPQDVYIDAPGVFDNDGNNCIDETYRTPFDANRFGTDYLGALYFEEYNGEQYCFWSRKGDKVQGSNKFASRIPSAYELGLQGTQAKALVTGKYKISTIVNLDENTEITSQPDITFGEANFGYQLAEYLHNLSTNDNEAYGSIAVVPPKSTSKADVYNWLGDFPVYDAAGTIIKNGKGILGYKLSSGSVGRIKGIFLTSNGLLNGSSVLDTRNNKVDIGRYIDVVSTPLIYSSTFENKNVVISGANVNGGFMIGLDAKTPTTNKQIPASFSILLDSLNNKSYDKLTQGRYVAFSKTAAGSPKIVDGVTFALLTSDWTRRSNCRIASAVIESTRLIADPYIGSMVDSRLRGALESQINEGLKALTTAGYITAGKATITATRVQEIRGEAICRLEMVTASELRRLTIYVALKK